MPTKKKPNQRDLELLRIAQQYVTRLREDDKTWRKFHEEAKNVLRK